MSDAVLQALLGKTVSPEALRDAVTALGPRPEVATAQGVVIVRLAEALGRSGVPIPGGLQRAASAERLRTQEVLAWMERLASLCRKEKVSFVFTKAFQHLPDMGHDIDLLLGSRLASIDAVLAREFGARAGEGSVSNWIAGKAAYDVPGLESPLEVHHGRMGQLGEHARFSELIVDRAVEFLGSNGPFPQPSPEDQLLIQTVQRLYCHFSFRCSDVIQAHHLLSSELDWKYILATARLMGISSGLERHMTYLSIILRSAGVEIPMPAVLKNVPQAEEELHLVGLCYRFPRWRVAGRLYAQKLLFDLRRLDAGSASRLSLLPVVAILAAARGCVRRLF